MKTVTITVALNQPYSDEDIRPLITAIKQLKGVANATAIEFTGDDQMNAWCYKQNWINEMMSKAIAVLSGERIA
jgi:hypothetical protein